MKSLYSSSLKNLNPKIKFPSLINLEKKNVLAPPVLLGPPELRRQAPQPPQPPLEPAPQQQQQQPAASSNPCLDFFFQVVPDTPSKSLKYRLRSAWAHDPLTTLKLVCNLRGVRGTGKSDKEGFYKAALWLHKNHPKTLASNVDSFAEFGYFKDLLEILYRILEGSEVRDIQKAELARGRQCRIQKSGTRKSVPRETRIAAAEKRNQEIQEKASELRKEKRMAMAKKVLERHSTDPNFKFLYE
ncbi:hypothetical protein Q3G72_012130 [Acer saccharum]|nr:hypothetical protein Q3G72_012130 [Acer saccharum]